MNGCWISLETRDAVVLFIISWSAKTEIASVKLLQWLGLNKSKFHSWRHRIGVENRHNSLMPRSTWIEEWERLAILAAYCKHPKDGYRRLAYVLLDIGIVCVSPSTVYRVLSEANALRRWNRSPNRAIGIPRLAPSANAPRRPPMGLLRELRC